MSILQNAIDSIIIGVEDYNMDDKRRLISSTRNMYAGILLLFKENLVRLSPHDSDEVLIKQRILPQFNEDNGIVWIGKGNKTVDTFSIEERFKSLNINVDWKRLKKINEYRNNIEHYYSNESKESVNALLSDSFLVIHEFIREYLKEDPRTLLGEDTYNILLEINEVYQIEKEDCISTYHILGGVGKYFLSALEEYNCEFCGSGLIEWNNDRDFICRTCSYVYEEDYLIEKVLSRKYNLSFEQMKDGESEPLVTCPYCNKLTYLMFEQECQSCCHVACHECECGDTLNSWNIEQDEDICDSCKNRMEKLEKE